MNIELNENATCMHNAFVGVDAAKISTVVENTVNEFMEKVQKRENFTFADVLQRAALGVETPGELCLLVLELDHWWMQVHGQESFQEEEEMYNQVREQLSELFKEEDIPEELKNSGIMVAGLGGGLRSLASIIGNGNAPKENTRRNNK